MDENHDLLLAWQQISDEIDELVDDDPFWREFDKLDALMKRPNPFKEV